jgi:hypothetical protein
LLFFNMHDVKASLPQADHHGSFRRGRSAALRSHSISSCKEV